MPSGRNQGLVQTVLGPVQPSELGATTTHEHIYIDFSFMYRPAQDSPSQELGDAPITLENLGWIRRNYYSNRSNLHLMDLDTTIGEVRKYREVGGGAIVDATSTGIGRNPEALAQISRESGVHIVMGAGFYVAAVHPEDMDARSVEDLAREITGDIVEGVDGSGVKAGVIGEVGCTWPLAPNERKSLSAAAIAQTETGAAILIHPGRHPDAPLEILEVLANGGADLSRVIMGHLDRTVFEFDALQNIAASGCYLEWDLFGNEGSYYPLAEIDMPSDAQRLGFIKRAVEAGYSDRIVIGQDICTKHRLVKYGGHGYGHILENIVPKMRRKGFSGLTTGPELLPPCRR
jgi:phosphotriesterase-related protein